MGVFCDLLPLVYFFKHIKAIVGNKNIHTEKLSLPVVIMAGGLGTRLRKSLMGKPKVMASVNGRPFVSYLLDALEQFGIKKVVICTGFMADYVERRLGYVHGNMSLIYSKEEKLL